MAYTGQVAELPLGLDGLTGTHNMAQVRPTELLIAKNLTYENGTLQKEGGATSYGTAPAGIIAGFDWWPTSAVQRSIALCTDGKLYKDTGAGTYGVTLASGLSTPSAPVMFAEGGREVAANNRKLFIATGSNQLKVLAADGATVANVASPAADWVSSFPTGVFQNSNRMFAFGGADPHRIYYSTQTSHEDFVTGGAGNAGSLSIYPGEGDKIAACMSFKGHVIVFKFPKGIYDVDTSDPDPANWRVVPMTRAVGSPGPGCVVNLDDDILFLDITGNGHLLSAVREFGDFGLKPLTEKSHMNVFIRDNFNLSRLPFAQSFLYDAKREVHFALADLGSTNNSRRLVIDLNDVPNMKWRYSDWSGTEANAIWLRRDANNIPRPTWGGNPSGKVRIADSASKYDAANGNAAYEARFKSPHYDLSHIDPTLAIKNKIGDFLELIVEPEGNWTLTVDIYWDGVYTDTVQFQTGISGATLGTFTLDIDMLGADQILNRKKRIVGSGRRLSLEGYNANAGEDFSIAKFILHYRIGDERIK